MAVDKMHISMKNSYNHMRNRCYATNSKDYLRYGARGIKVCERWLGKDGYINFLADMGNKPSLEYSLDRIDNNGNYEPNNCKWSTRVEQCLNRRSNHLVTINGITKCLSEWMKHTDLKKSTISQRINVYGWNEEDALFTPLMRKRS